MALEAGQGLEETGHSPVFPALRNAQKRRAVLLAGRASKMPHLLSQSQRRSGNIHLGGPFFVGCISRKKQPIPSMLRPITPPKPPPSGHSPIFSKNNVSTCQGLTEGAQELSKVGLNQIVLVLVIGCFRFPWFRCHRTVPRKTLESSWESAVSFHVKKALDKLRIAH